MKNLLSAFIIILPLVFTACSRDEPSLPVVPPVPVVETIKINEVYSAEQLRHLTGLNSITPVPHRLMFPVIRYMTAAERPAQNLK